MGDVLRAIPAVRLIRTALPDAAIHWIVEPPWHALLEGHRDLDGVVLAPRREWASASLRPGVWPAPLGSLRRFGRSIRGLRPDLAVDFHGNLRSGILARWSGAPVRLGYAGHEQKEGNRLLTTHRIPSGDRRTPRIERNLALVRALGFADEPLPACELPLLAAGEDEARAIVHALPGARTDLAVVSPGASLRQAYKRPPAELLAAACAHLARRAIRPLVVWGPGEEPQARAVVEAAGGHAVLAPPTGLASLAGLLSRSRLFVGGDTGPMHLACAVGCPVIAVYGPTDPLVNRPWSEHFRVVVPPGRRYTGIKRIDRRSGGFAGIMDEHLTRALDELLDATAGVSSRRS